MYSTGGSLDKQPPRSHSLGSTSASGPDQTEARYGGPETARTHVVVNALLVCGDLPDHRALNVGPEIDFIHISELCEKDKMSCDIDLSHQMFANHRREEWPDPDLGLANAHLSGVDEQLLGFVKYGFSYIRKNTVLRITQSHCLPSLNALVGRVQEIGSTAHLFTVNICTRLQELQIMPTGLATTCGPVERVVLS